MEGLGFVIALLALVVALAARRSANRALRQAREAVDEQELVASQLAVLTRRVAELAPATGEDRTATAVAPDQGEVQPVAATLPPEPGIAAPPAEPVAAPAEPGAVEPPPVELPPPPQRPVSAGFEPPPGGAPPGSRAAKPGWERRLGILVPVWLGAIALALAGAFLVKYSVERGWLGPGARVTLATLLGAILLIVGERLRGRRMATAAGASAAGIAVLYAAFLAATSLYHLISPWVAFTLLALVTATAVALSLRQGMVVAAVGLIGGFVTPFWIGAVTASPGLLFAYLLILQAGLMVVTRRREWTGLSALTLVAGLAAAASRVLGPDVALDGVWIGLFLLASAAVFVVTTRRWPDRRTVTLFDEGMPVGLGLVLTVGSLLGALALLVGLALRTRFAMSEWGFLGLLAIGVLLLTRFEREVRLLPWVVLAVDAALAAGWILSGGAGVSEVWLVGAGVLAVFGGGGWLLERRAGGAGGWGWLAACGGLVAFGLAWWVDRRQGDGAVHWGLIAIVLAVPYLLAALDAGRERGRRELGLGGYAVAVTALLSLAVPLELAHEWLTVAWAIEAAALAWLLVRLRLTILGYLGLAVATGAAVRLLVNPAVLGYPIGTTPVLNWLLYGYGVPALAFAGAGRLYRRAGWAQAGAALAWGSAALVLFLLTLETRHAFHPGGLVGPAPSLVELSTYSHLWLIAALVCLLIGRRRGRSMLVPIGSAYLVLAGVKVGMYELLAVNPLWTPAAVGRLPVVSWLLYVVALPTVAAAVAALLLHRLGRRRSAAAAAWGAAVIGVVWLTLTVRHAYHPPDLQGPWPTPIEWATISHAWLLAALLLTVAFRRWGSAVVGRIAAAFWLLAMVKLTLVDVTAGNPLLHRAEVGTVPLVNWLLYVYGVPLLALLLLPRAVGERRPAFGELSGAAHWTAVALVTVLVSLEVRQLFHPGVIAAGALTLPELATYTIAWVTLAALLLACWRRWASPAARWGAQLLLAAALVKLAVLDALVCNPLWWHQPVGGWPIVNLLLYVYAVPIALLALSARLPYPSPLGPRLGRIALYGGLALAFLLVNLEVRQLFHGAYLDVGALTDAENYSYSAAWLVFALVVLALAIARGGKVLRVASLVVVFLAVSKVFLYDLRELRDLFRVLSFLGLGASLLLISYLYQRFVFTGGGHEGS